MQNKAYNASDTYTTERKPWPALPCLPGWILQVLEKLCDELLTKEDFLSMIVD